MIYLEKTTEKQAILIPRDGIEPYEVDTFSLLNCVSLECQVITPISIVLVGDYIGLELRLNDTTPGEYRYALDDIDGIPLVTGLAKVKSDSEEVVSYHQDANFIQYNESNDYEICG